VAFSHNADAKGIFKGMNINDGAWERQSPDWRVARRQSGDWRSRADHHSDFSSFSQLNPGSKKA